MKKQVLIVPVVTFISFLAAALQYPVLAPLFLSPETSFSFMAFSNEALFGIAMAIYPFGQFLGAPISGAYSDIHGRRRALLLMLSMLSLGYLIMIYAVTIKNYLLFILARFFCGFWEGIVPTVRAMASDLKDRYSKAKLFGFINAATTLAYLVGPLVSGFLFLKYIDSSNIYLIFLLSFLTSLSSLACIGLLLQETNKNHELLALKQIKNKVIQRLKSLVKPIYSLNYVHLFLTSCLITLSFNLYYKFLPAILVKNMGCMQFDIALSTFVLASSMVTSQIFITRRLNNLFDLKYIIVAASVLLSLMYILVSKAPSYYYVLLINMPVGVLIGVIGINIPMYISDKSPQEYQGQILGLMMSLKYISEAIMTTVSGFISTYSIYAPILLGAFLILCGSSIFIYYLNCNYKTKASLSTV